MSILRSSNKSTPCGTMVVTDSVFASSSNHMSTPNRNKTSDNKLTNEECPLHITYKTG